MSPPKPMPRIPRLWHTPKITHVIFTHPQRQSLLAWTCQIFAYFLFTKSTVEVFWRRRRKLRSQSTIALIKLGSHSIAPRNHNGITNYTLKLFRHKLRQTNITVGSFAGTPRPRSPRHRRKVQVIAQNDYERIQDNTESAPQS